MGDIGPEGASRSTGLPVTSIISGAGSRRFASGLDARSRRVPDRGEVLFRAYLALHMHLPAQS
jgi:hypothetical protein